MIINKVWALYFSPAGSTGYVVTNFAKHLAGILRIEYCEHDFTLPEMRKDIPVFDADDLIVFGTPVYAGRIPNKMLEYVSSVTGNQTHAILIVTYGNRSFQDALSELRIVLSGNGFIPIGAAAMVSRHAMSNTLAADRPSEDDLERAYTFADRLAERISSGEIDTVLHVPGNNPVGAYYRPLQEDGTLAVFLKAKPKTRESCTQCGICVAKCPMGSISEDCRSVPGICIKCHACVRYCPEGAKYFDDPSLASHIRYLEEHYGDVHREAEFFSVG